MVEWELELRMAETLKVSLLPYAVISSLLWPGFPQHDFLELGLFRERTPPKPFPKASQ